METQVQNENVFTEEPVRSPAERLKIQWRQQPGPTAFFRERNVVSQNHDLLPYVGTVSLKGWLSPRAFAVQGLLITALVLSFFNWSMTRRSGKYQEQINQLRAEMQEELKRQRGVDDAMQAEIDRIRHSPRTLFRVGASPELLDKQQAIQQLEKLMDDSKKSEQQYQQKMKVKEADLRANRSSAAVARSLAPFMFSLALMMSASLVASGIRKDYRKSPFARFAEDLYLYFTTTRAFLPNLGFLVALHFALSASVYGVADFGPIVWIVFWLAFYVLAGRLFLMVARDLYKAMQIRPPANELDLENRILLRIHNSFWIVFLGLEGVLVLLSYLYYMAARG